MKKLIAMLSVVGMAFGLFAANYAISFEEAEQDKGVNTTSMLFTPVVSDTEWAWTTEEALPLKAYGTETKFAYGTGAHARRDDKFAGMTDNANYLPLSTGSDKLTRAVGTDNLYLDQLVKFTGFEDPQTNLVAGTKIAVWMSEFENDDDESTTTNLYVTVGKVTDDGVKQVALQIKGDYKLDTWYRLTVKALEGGIYTSAVSDSQRAGFLVWINGLPAVTDDEAAKSLTPFSSEMTSVAANYMSQGRLFTAIDATDATFTSVGYQGIGAIDDIIVDAKGPDFCVETVETVDVTFADITGAVITKVVDSDGTVFTDFTSAISVKPGKLTVTLAAAEGYKMTSSGEYIVEVSAAGQLTVKVVEGDFVKVYATKVNGKTTTEYGAAELLTMINNLVNGDVVTFNLGSTITNTVEGAEVTLYSFTADTTITVSVDNGVTTWTIASKTAEDLINDNCGVAENFRKVYELIDDSSSVVFSGEVAGTFKAAYLSNGDAPITLSGAGKVITMSEVDVYDSDNNLVTPTAGVPEAGWYTYALSDVPPAADVAQIGAKKYPTLGEAIAALTDGETIELLGNYTATTDEANDLTFNANATLDLGGYTLTVPGAVMSTQKFGTAAGTTVTFMNGVINMPEDGGNRGITIYGTLNLACKVVRNGAHAPAFDVMNGATINAGDDAEVESDAIVFWVKKAGSRTWNITGGKYTTKLTSDDYTIFYFSYADCEETLNITAGEFNSPLAIIHDMQHNVVHCSLDDTCAAKFSNNTDLAQYIKAGYEAVKGEDNYYTIQAIPSYTVAAISVANASVVATNKTAGGATFALPADLLRDTEIAVTVTPNENYEYKNAPTGWTKNGDGSITTNATVTADLAITVEAPTAAITPVDPETPKSYDSKEAADAAADAINANKTAMIKTPDGADAADYTALFTAVVKANNAVVVELNEGGTNALKTAADTIKTAVANKLGDIAAAAAGGNVEVVVTGVEPGFWYGVAATADLTTMGASQPGEWKQATTEGVTLTVTKPDTGNAAFFQTRVKVK